MLNCSNDDKARMFDEIAAHFYERNFGVFSKSEMDLLMFHLFLENEIKQHTKNDGCLDYSAVSDYAISKELGITQQRVKSLKI